MVSHIVINGTGLYEDGRNDKNEERQCTSFKPTLKEITKFFNIAKESKEAGELLSEYYSPCLAIGLVTFKDGSSADWTIQSGGLAIVNFNDGTSSVFFHSNNKWNDPFACTYGLGDEPKC